MNKSRKLELQGAAIRLAGDLREGGLKYGLIDQSLFVHCMLGLGRAVQSLNGAGSNALRVHYEDAIASLPEIRAHQAFAEEKPRIEGQAACLIASVGNPTLYAIPAAELVFSVAPKVSATEQELIYMVAVVIALTALPDEDITEELLTSS